VNFITAHDGFTLHDLVSYNDKHNEANGEENRDGHDHNLSWNCGVEGPTDDPKVLALRDQQMRNLLATLFLSQGVPMLCAGDEVARTQLGNNNAYCQDSELSWIDWNLDERRQRLLRFARRLIRLRREHPVFRRRRFFQGREIHGSEMADLTWFRPDGKRMTTDDWLNPHTKCLGMLLAGDAMDEVDDAGERIVDATFLVLLNAHWEPVQFTLPEGTTRREWEVLFHTPFDPLPADQRVLQEAQFDLGGRAMALLRLVDAELP
jgi:glycogen operon protein